MHKTEITIPNLKIGPLRKQTAGWRDPGDIGVKKVKLLVRLVLEHCLKLLT